MAGLMSTISEVQEQYENTRDMLKKFKPVRATPSGPADEAQYVYDEDKMQYVLDEEDSETESTARQVNLFIPIFL